jgi:TonB-dependent receptor
MSLSTARRLRDAGPPRWAALLAVLLAPGLALAQTGTIAGTVVDGDFGGGLPGATVFVEGLQAGDAADLDGNYQIESVPVGTYSVRFSYTGYGTQTVENVEVAAGETARINVTLMPGQELDEIIVEAEEIIATNSEVGLDRVRAKAAAVSDAISAETISQSGASDAADAVERVTGVSVQGGQYVYVRGLGDRYANTQLNGSVLPTSDPDRRAVQFDLFPSSFLENITTLKTFTPDKPGSFSGGLVDITTKSFPSEFSASLSVSSGFSTEAVPGDAYIVDPVRGVGPFQFGTGDLAMPDLLANTAREDFLRPTTTVQTPNGPVFARNDPASAERIDALSNALSPMLAPVEGTVPVNGSFGFSLGDRVDLGDNALGYVLGLTGGQGASYYDGGTLGRVEVQGTDTGLAVDTTQNRTDVRATQEANLGGIANLAYRLGSFNELNLNTLFSHSVESDARQLPGFDNILREGAEVTDLATTYTERTLGSAQLRGEHRLPGLGDLQINWRGNYSETALDQPDQRFATILRTTGDEGDEQFGLVGTPPGPQRFFRDLNETLQSGALDLTLPFRALGGRGEAKVGGLVEQTERDYNERFFFYEINRRIPLTGTSGEALAEFLSDENVGIMAAPDEPGGRYEFGNYLIDATRDQNSYTGQFDVGAVYGMAEVPLGRLRAIVGARYEPSTLFVASRALATDETPADSTVIVDGEAFLGTDRSYNDLLPALNLVYAVGEQMNLRAAATRTLARPTFREIAPVSTFDFGSGGALVGNPGLERTLITNLDLRWEWFNRPGQILAVSTFYKDLSNPIERVIIDPENGSTSYDNVDQATVLGAEFEARQTLGTLGVPGGLAQRLALGLNLTVAQSSITITERELAARRAVDPDAEDTRDLQGQSPYLLNASLSYDNAERGTALGLFFNVAGRRLSRVGNPLPDVYEEPSPQLDVTLSQAVGGLFSIKASAKNVLNASYREAYDLDQEVIPFQEYNRGVRFSLGISLDPTFGFARPASVPSPGASGLPVD